MTQRMKWWVVAGLALAVAVPLVWAQSVTRRTDIFQFVNGLRLASQTFTALRGSSNAIQLGDSSATSVTIVTDGGTVTIDGSVSAAGDVTLSNGETITNGVDGTILLGRNTAGTLTVTAADNDATAALSILPGGAAALTLGGGSATAITLTTDGGSLIVDGPNVSTGTGGTFTVLRSDAGTVTVVAADDDATAALVVKQGGAAALTLGDSSATSVTIQADGAQDADLVLPENSVAGQEISGVFMNVIFCGQAEENATTYLGPATAILGGDGSTSYAISSAACDALDNTTESTADAPLFTNVAFKVAGLYCKTSGTLGASETVVFTMRSAAAGTTPAITCTISEAQSDCRSLTGTTTDIAAGATVAVQAVQSSNNADDDLWCSVSIALQ